MKRLLTLLLATLSMGAATNYNASFTYDLTGLTKCTTTITKNCYDHFEIGYFNPDSTFESIVSIPMPSGTGVATGIPGVLVVNRLGEGIKIAAIVVTKDNGGGRFTSDASRATFVLPRTNPPAEPTDFKVTGTITLNFKVDGVLTTQKIDVAQAVEK